MLQRSIYGKSPSLKPGVRVDEKKPPDDSGGFLEAWSRESI